MTPPEDSGMSGHAQPPEGFDAQRTPLERQQHLALTYVGGLLQNTPAGWRLRGSNEDVGLAWRKANAALMAYHEAASVEAAPPSALRPSSPEEYDGPEWTCRECGADRFDGIFRTVTHSTPGEADDYDVACPRCGSAEVSESPREALGHVTADRDALRADLTIVQKALADVVNNLGNGSFASTDSSADFLKHVPEEVASVLKALRAERDAALADRALGKTWEHGLRKSYEAAEARAEAAEKERDSLKAKYEK